MRSIRGIISINNSTNMTATFKTFHSGIGDCIFFLIKKEEEQRVVMVDCGTFEVPIKKYVQEKLAKKIDLLIVTHIDNDHIEGVKTMLNDPEIKVGRIIFNCYQRNAFGEKRRLNKYQMERLSNIEKEIGLIVGDIIENAEHDVDAPEAMKGLAATILGKPALKRAWDKDYTVSGNEIDMAEWGKITFLSPTMNEIDNLDKDFRHVMFDELNVDQTLGKWDKKEELYEILLRYAMLQAPVSDELREKDASGADELEERLTKAAKEPVDTDKISTANKASLAFVWEKGEHKMLFMGDANPDIVVKGLLEHYKGTAFPVLFDAIKVSHHGSHYNTTTELMRHADSAHYFFTGGLEGKRPSEEAIGRMALNAMPEGLTTRTFHFNYETTLVKELKENKALQEKYQFNVDTTKNEKEFAV